MTEEGADTAVPKRLKLTSDTESFKPSNTSPLLLALPNTLNRPPEGRPPPPPPMDDRRALRGALAIPPIDRPEEELDDDDDDEGWR